MSTYSQDLRIELLANGAQAGTWGDTTNGTFAYLFESAIAGFQEVPITSTSQLLSYINGASSIAADNQSIYAMLQFTGASADTAVYAPPTSKQYILWNDSGHKITIYNSDSYGVDTPRGDGVEIVDGTKVLVWSDATNFYEVQSSNITGILPIAHGGTGADNFNDAGIVTYTGIQTLTNKTLTAPAINMPVFGSYGSVKALFETATVTASAPASTTNYDILTQTVQYYTSNATTNFTLNIRATAGATPTAGSFIIGGIYTIASIGTTDFTLIGAASNTVGVTFTATGIGTGTGTATTTGALNEILSVGQAVTCTLLVTNGATTTVTAGAFIVGNTYTILTVGSGTNWTSIGAASATVGVTFIATGVGSGTGTATANPFYPSVVKIDGTTVTPKWQNGITATANYASAVTVYTFSIIKTASATYTVLGSQVKFA